MKSSSDLLQHTEIIVLASKSIMMHLNNEENIIIIFKPTTIEESIVIPEGYVLELSSTTLFEDEGNGTFNLQDIGTYIFIKGSDLL
jgi:hypothetical protein